MRKPLKLAILGSTRGTSMLGLIRAIQANQLAARIEIVISNKADALIVERAKENHLPTLCIDSKGSTREAYDQKLSEKLQELDIDLIVLIGYMRILSAFFIARWPHQIINVHPSLLPAFAGGMDKQVHQAVLDAGLSETGCTVHFVTEEVDLGPLLIQKKCPVLSNDTADTLKARVQQLEGEALVEAIKKLHLARVL